MNHNETHYNPKPQSAQATNMDPDMDVTQVIPASKALEDAPCSCPSCFSFDF